MKQRILKLELVRVGFSSIGLDPGSMAYTSAMHGSGDRLLRDPRPERSLLGAFSARDRSGMDPAHGATVEGMA